jgi:hypothetical protein
MDAVLVGLVATIIIEHPTCLACIAVEVGTSQREVLQCVELLRETIRIRPDEAARCRVCGVSVGPVYALAPRD